MEFLVSNAPFSDHLPVYIFLPSGNWIEVSPNLNGDGKTRSGGNMVSFLDETG